MAARTSPDSKKDPTVATIYWFYTQFQGKKPDASIYARHRNKANPKALFRLFERDPELDNETYKACDVSDMIYHLEDEGFTASDISIAMMPGLMYNYMNRNVQECRTKLNETIEYLKGRDGKNNNASTNFKPPTGW